MIFKVGEREKADRSSPPGVAGGDVLSAELPNPSSFMLVNVEVGDFRRWAGSLRLLNRTVPRLSNSPIPSSS